MGDRNTFGRRLAHRLFGERLLEAIRERRTSRRTQHSPDRRLLVETLLPPIAKQGGQILWIGCRRYTQGYPALLEANGGQCWTTDIDPQAAAFGRKGRHRVGDVQTLDTLFADRRFDVILCNGVLGYGVDEEPAQRRAMEGMAAVLNDGGALLLGWNTDKIDDPIRPAIIDGLFAPTPRWGVAERIPVPGTTHVYDLLGKSRSSDSSVLGV